MQKVIVITGTGSGIGLATANYLIEKGYKVYGISRREHKDATFPSYACDVRDGGRINAILAEIAAKEGGIYALVNNAGYGISGAVERHDGERVREMFDVDVCATVNLCAAAIPYLRATGGRIINIGSVASVIPIPFQACYSAAKAAVENFSRALANELRPFKIKVTCILPGDTATGFTDSRIKFGDDGAYCGKVEKSVSKMERDERNGKSPLTVAKAVFKAINSKRPPLRITVGAEYKFIVFIARLLPLKTVNYIVSKLYT